MLKETLKNYLDGYFETYKKHMGSYPTVPYNEDEISTLWFGEADDEDYIQWIFKEKTIQTDFSGLEQDFNLTLPNEVKEFYNSFFFLQLHGFYHGESVIFDDISDTKDILQAVNNGMFKMNGKHYLQMGIYSSMDLALCIDIDTAEIVYADPDSNKIEKLANSLEEFLGGMTPIN